LAFGSFTAELCELVAGADVPAAFVAVTVTRSVLFASDSVGVYVDVVAPAIETHLAPFESQRSHW
jgi:hypothetical protein